MKAFYTLPERTIVVLLFVVVFVSCGSDDDMKIPKTITLSKFAVSNTTIVNYKALTGSDNGAVISDDITIKDNAPLGISENALKETVYTFIENTDSVIVNGVVYAQLETTRYYHVPNIWIYAVDLKFNYKFENGHFMLYIENDINSYINDQWLTIGYGSKDKISVYVENKVIYSDIEGGTSQYSVRFVDPQMEAEVPTDPVWVSTFFESTHQWQYLYNFDTDYFLPGYRACWYICQYDYMLSEETEVAE